MIRNALSRLFVMMRERIKTFITFLTISFFCILSMSFVEGKNNDAKFIKQSMIDKMDKKILDNLKKTNSYQCDSDYKIINVLWVYYSDDYMDKKTVCEDFENYIKPVYYKRNNLYNVSFICNDDNKLFAYSVNYKVLCVSHYKGDYFLDIQQLIDLSIEKRIKRFYKFHLMPQDNYLGVDLDGKVFLFKKDDGKMVSYPIEEMDDEEWSRLSCVNNVVIKKQ